MTTHVLTRWNPEDAAFWESEGRAVASRNLWISIPSLTARLRGLDGVERGGGEPAQRRLQVFDRASCSGSPRCRRCAARRCGFSIPSWCRSSAAGAGPRSPPLRCCCPTIGIGFAVQDPATSYSTLVVLALLCGFGGGNFASSMANISFFFPKAQKGTALGLNAGLGNLGVSLVQFVVPLVITAGVFGALGGEPQTWTKGAEVKQMWLQNAGFIWVPFIAIFADRGLVRHERSRQRQGLVLRPGGDLQAQAQLDHVLALSRHLRFVHRLFGRLPAADQEPVSADQRALLRLARPAGRRPDPAARRLAVRQAGRRARDLLELSS